MGLNNHQNRSMHPKEGLPLLQSNVEMYFDTHHGSTNGAENQQQQCDTYNSGSDFINARRIRDTEYLVNKSYLRHSMENNGILEEQIKLKLVKERVSLMQVARVAEERRRLEEEERLAVEAITLEELRRRRIAKEVEYLIEERKKLENWSNDANRGSYVDYPSTTMYARQPQHPVIAEIEPLSTILSTKKQSGNLFESIWMYEILKKIEEMRKEVALQAQSSPGSSTIPRSSSGAPLVDLHEGNFSDMSRFNLLRGGSSLGERFVTKSMDSYERAQMITVGGMKGEFEVSKGYEQNRLLTVKEELMVEKLKLERMLEESTTRKLSDLSDEVAMLRRRRLRMEEEQRMAEERERQGLLGTKHWLGDMDRDRDRQVHEESEKKTIEGESRWYDNTNSSVGWC